MPVPPFQDQNEQNPASIRRRGLIWSLQGIESGVRASLQSELDAIKDTIKDAITADA